MLESCVTIAHEADIITSRQAGRDIARQLGMGTADQTRVATAISELARNAWQYAGGGVCRVEGERENGHVVLRVEVADEGPGIADVDQAMQDGFSTGRGLGAGLPGTRRLMDDLHIETVPGRTVIRATMRRVRR